jgi:hypothetical protein
LQQLKHIGGQLGLINRLRPNWRPSSRKFPQARLLAIILIIAGILDTIGDQSSGEGG